MEKDKSPRMIDHDRSFKELLTTFFAEFLELFLPEVLQYLDVESVTWLDKELFTDIAAGERLEADLVARARFRDGEAFFLFHIESQAQPQDDFAERMFRYFIHLYQKYGLPVYPIVIFSYASPRTAQPDSFSISFPDFDVCAFHYRVIQLNRLHWRDYLNTSNPVATALMAKMQIAKKDRPRVKAECLRLLVTLRLNPAKMQLIFGFVDTYLRLSAEEYQEFRQTLAQIAPESEEKIMPLMGQSEERGWLRGVQEGMQTGLQEGIQTGRQEGAQTLLLRMLEHRVGPLDELTRTHLAALPWPQLEELGMAVPDFTSAKDLQNWLDGRTAH